MCSLPGLEIEEDPAGVARVLSSDLRACVAGALMCDPPTPPCGQCFSHWTVVTAPVRCGQLTPFHCCALCHVSSDRLCCGSDREDLTERAWMPASTASSSLTLGRLLNRSELETALVVCGGSAGKMQPLGIAFTFFARH